MSVRKIIVTGKPGSGKTSFLEKLLPYLPKDSRGFLSKNIREAGRRVGFEIIGISTGLKEVLAHVNHRTGFKVGKYGVNIRGFEKVAKAELEHPAPLYLIDEYGSMELFSLWFKNRFWELMESDTPVIAVVQAKQAEALLKLSKMKGVHFIYLQHWKDQPEPSEVLGILDKKT